MSFEDYVGMSACVPVMGYEQTLAHYRITSAQWSMIAAQWNALIPTNAHYMQYGAMVEQESARLRAGGAPRPVTIGAGAPPPPPPQAQPQPYNAYPNPYQQPGAQVGAQIGSALGSFASAFGSLVDSAVGGIAVGSRVMVTWSDGKRYPATITAVGQGQVEVAFPDGRRQWVPQQYVSVHF